MILRSPRIEVFCADFYPTLSVLLVSIPKKKIVFTREWQMIDVWIQVVYPTVTKLFLDAKVVEGK
jgi:hypothetical protein